MNSKFLALLLISLYISFQATLVLYQAYPLKELVEVQPSAYELDAIQFIHSDATGRYVVLCEPNFGWLAIGFLGSDYAYGSGRGLFGPGDWGYQTVQLYLEMAKQPAISYMRQAMDFGSAEVSYFVVSVRNPDFEEVVERTLEVLPVNKVFGDGKLYVFKYPLLIVEKSGPAVKVVYDDGLGLEYVQTKLVYMVESEVNSTLTYSGYTSYNVTEFPAHWTFLDLTVNNVSKPFDESSDINTFIYVKGLERSDVLTVKWRLNLNYPEVSWKEDSFKKEWQPHPTYGGVPGKPPIIDPTDGNVLRISYSFVSGEYWYYYHVTSVGVSTNDHSYLLMRWKSNLPIAVAYAYFDFEFKVAEEIISFGSKSVAWTTTAMKLPSDVTLTNVMIGLSNARDKSPSGTGTLEVDFILIASKATP